MNCRNRDAIGNSRGATLVPDFKFGSAYFNVTRLMEAYHDCEEGSGNRRGAIVHSEKYFLFKQKSVPETRFTILESKSAILRPEDC
jgi:hypothetical protein